MALSSELNNTFLASYAPFRRLLYLTLFLFLIDKAVQFFLPPLPGGVKHFLLFFIFFINWLTSGAKIIRSNQPYYFILFSLSIYLCILFFVTDVAFLNFSLGVFFTFLFSIIFILAVNTKTSVELLFKFFHSILYIFLFLSLFTIIPSLFLRISINQSYFGFFRELGAFGAVLNISCIIALTIFLKTRKRKFLFIAILCTFFIVLTIMKKSILSNAIIWVLYAFLDGNVKYKFVNFFLIGFVFLGSILFVRQELTENISLNIDYFDAAGDSHVRIAMYLASIAIVRDHFPFGTGTGTFGSLPSLYNGYSKVYYDYSINTIEPLSPERVAAGEGHTLFDTFWPHIIGELGAIGFLLFLILWFYPLIKAYSKLRSNNPIIKALSFYVVSIGLIMTFDGVVLYTPEISSFILFHSGITGFCIYHIKRLSSIS